MASFPTSNISASSTILGFGGQDKNGMGRLAYDNGASKLGIVPPGWQVSGNSKPPADVGILTDLNRFRGGGYEPSQSSVVYCTQGDDVAAGGIFTGESNVFGYSKLTPKHGTLSNQPNDEGWETIQIVAIAEKVPLIWSYGFLLAIGCNNEKLVNSLYNNSSARLSLQVSNANYGNGTYLTDNATAISSFVYQTWNMLQIFWDAGVQGPGSPYNPFDKSSVNITVNRLNYI